MEQRDHQGSRPTGQVVVGYDGTWHGRQAVLAAAEEAAVRDVPLAVVTLCDPPVDHDLTFSAQARKGRDARRRLRWALHLVHERHPALTSSGAVLSREGRDELGRLLGDCHLLVLGSRGETARSAFSPGSGSRDLVRAVASPVLVVPEQRPPAPSRSDSAPVLAGIDGSPAGDVVLRVAAEQARCRRGRLQVLHSYTRRPDEEAEEALTRARRTCAESISTARLTADMRVTSVLTGEPAPSELLRQSSSAALLVIGSRDPLALAGRTVDSVSRDMLGAALSPVLVVPTGVPLALLPSPRAATSPTVGSPR